MWAVGPAAVRAAAGPPVYETAARGPERSPCGDGALFAQTLAELCQNAQQEQTRLQAARALLEQAARLTETVDFDRRLAALEELREDEP